jgi:hypothetical protein
MTNEHPPMIIHNNFNKDITTLTLYIASLKTPITMDFILFGYVNKLCHTILIFRIKFTTYYLSRIYSIPINN